MKNAAKHEKFAFGRLENIYSSLSALAKASFVFHLYNENAPNTLKMACAQT